MTRRAPLVAVALLVLLGAGLVAFGARRSSASGDGVRTVDLGIHHSRFSTSTITVHAGETVRFVITNDDPILHELIVGPPDVHARHEAGTEAAHAPRPGEVTIPPLTTATTEYTFTAPGSVEYACHLPGHHAYGMTGVVVVVVV